MLGDLNRITSKVPVTRFKSEKGHPDDILAKWVFINPLVAHRANSVLIKSGKSTKSLASKMHLTDSAVELPRRKLGTDSNGRDFVQVVHQRANCIITIPAGWLHQVTNFSVCLKLAWELIDANKLYLYALSWHFISSCVTVNNAPDYMFVESILLKQVDRLVRDLKL
ncbi:TPA: hypothetical protein ACH3X1_014782 [Trebouxia sp. C0004]